MEKYMLKFYVKENGDIPVQDFIDSMDKKVQAKIYRDLNLLMDYGPNLPFPHASYMENKIYELRTQADSMNVRIFYFFVVDNKIILTNGYTKKTQKTPQTELETAKKYYNDYIKRDGGES